MGWFDGFPFKSREQIEKDRKRFQGRMLPFGDPQKQAALAVLKQVASPKLREEELLFAFFTAKDKYLLGQEDSTEVEDAQRALKRVPGLLPQDKQIVVALVLLDCALTSLEEYPTPQQVLETASKLG